MRGVKYGDGFCNRYGAIPSQTGIIWSLIAATGLFVIHSLFVFLGVNDCYRNFEAQKKQTESFASS
jgi:hypothetical protein